MSVRRSSSNVAEPPVLAPSLHACDPATKWIEDNNNRDPDQVDAQQADTKALRKESVVRQELLCCKSLRDAEQHGCGMNQIKMRDVERERRASERHQCVPE